MTRSSLPRPAAQRSRLLVALGLHAMQMAGTFALAAPWLEALGASGFDDRELAADGSLLLVEFVRFVARDFRPSAGSLALVAASFVLAWARAPVELWEASKNAGVRRPTGLARWLAVRFLLRATLSICGWILLASVALRWSRHGFDGGTLTLLAVTLLARPLSLLFEVRLAGHDLSTANGRASTGRSLGCLALLGLVDLAAILVAFGGTFVPETLFILGFLGAEGLLFGLEVARLGYLTRLASASIR